MRRPRTRTTKARSRKAIDARITRRLDSCLILRIMPQPERRFGIFAVTSGRDLNLYRELSDHANTVPAPDGALIVAMDPVVSISEHSEFLERLGLSLPREC